MLRSIRLASAMAAFFFAYISHGASAALVESDFLFPIDGAAVLTTKAGGETFTGTSDPFHSPQQAYFSLDFDNGSSSSVQILAAKAGTIVHVGALQFENSTIGKFWVPNIIISHGNGIFTQYLEFATKSTEAEAINQIKVNLGSFVQPGQVLGTMNAESQTHLHLQVRYDQSGDGTGVGLSTDSAPLGNITVGGKLIEAYDFSTPVGTATPINIRIKTTGDTSTKLNHIDTATLDTALLSIGGASSGSLSISDGARLIGSGTLIGGQSPIESGTGSATVQGTGTEWLNSFPIYVGTVNDGALFVRNGASVSGNGLGIGTLSEFSSGKGLVEVVGSGSSLMTGSTYASAIGFNANGTLIIRDGAVVKSIGSYVGGYGVPNNLLFGVPSGIGRVTVTGPNSRWINSGPVFIGSFGGLGIVQVQDGGLASAVEFRVGPRGFLEGTGYSGNVSNLGGRIRPGSSPGTMFIDGDLSLVSGTLELEVENGMSDKLVVSGIVSIGSAALFDVFFDVLPETSVISDFFEAADLMFDPAFLYSNISVFTSDETAVGNAVNVLFGNQQANIIAQSFPPSAVPLPAAFPLFLTAIFAVGFLGWSRTRAI